MKTFVLTVSEQFPKTHVKAGQYTDFVNNILNRKKIHTIRANYDFWSKRAKDINEGKAILSIRIWGGKPYHSRQIEFLQLRKIGVQKLEYPNNIIFATCERKFIEWGEIAKNDGLSFDDFDEWFKVKTNDPMAIILFTDFRY